MRPYFILPALLAFWCINSLAAPNLTISYVDLPTTVTANQSIDLWVEINVDQPIPIRQNAPFAEWDESEFPLKTKDYNQASGKWYDATFSEYTQIVLSQGGSCYGNCFPKGYDVVLAAWGNSDNPLLISGREYLTSGRYKVATLTPKETLEEGFYTWSYHPNFTYQVFGVSVTGAHISGYIGQVNGYETCQYLAIGDCQHTFMVTSVPEPSTWILFGFGMVGLFFASRRALMVNSQP